MTFDPLPISPSLTAARCVPFDARSFQRFQPISSEKSCPKLFCGFDLLGGWVRFAKTAALIVLKVFCTHKKVYCPASRLTISCGSFDPHRPERPRSTARFARLIRLVQ